MSGLSNYRICTVGLGATPSCVAAGLSLCRIDFDPTGMHIATTAAEGSGISQDRIGYLVMDVIVMETGLGRRDHNVVIATGAGMILPDEVVA